MFKDSSNSLPNVGYSTHLRVYARSLEEMDLKQYK